MDSLIRIKFGSHLYGTNTAKSDIDYKSVHIPDRQSILLQRAKPVIISNTKLDASAKNQAGDVDDESYALHKYLALVSEGQTVAMDMLFSPPQSWVMRPAPAWEFLIDSRHRLVSRNCKSFVGYCRQQANKYGIKGSRMAAARAARDFFAVAVKDMGTTAKIEVIGATLADFVAAHEHCALVDIEAPGPRIVRHIEVCNRKMPFTATLKAAAEVYDRLFTEYGERARQAEQNANIDWKAMSHAVRVGRQAIELLDTGFVTFPRPERGHLLAIKQGELPYKQVAEEVERLLTDVEAAAERSTLPDRVEPDFLDSIVVEQYGAACR